MVASISCDVDVSCFLSPWNLHTMLSKIIDSATPDFFNADL
jgi:hypothetical protein